MWIQAVAAAAALVIPLGLDLYMPVPEDNPLTAERIALGRRLFSDRRLSRDGSVSCASCHRPDRAFADGRPVAIGVSRRVGRRNAPALINRGYGRAFFWDARNRSLEDQVLRPIEDPNEMDSDRGDRGSACGTHARRVVAGAGELRPLDPLGQLALRPLCRRRPRGADRRGTARAQPCSEARATARPATSGPNFTDERVHNTGIAWRTSSGQARTSPADAGAGDGAFKTPTLREIARTAPYMHDGSLASLDDVVDFYDRGGQTNPHLDDEIRPLKLTADERRGLLAFLRALSGDVQEGGRVGR